MLVSFLVQFNSIIIHYVMIDSLKLSCYGLVESRNA